MPHFFGKYQKTVDISIEVWYNVLRINKNP